MDTTREDWMSLQVRLGACTPAAVLRNIAGRALSMGEVGEKAVGEAHRIAIAADMPLLGVWVSRSWQQWGGC